MAPFLEDTAQVKTVDDLIRFQASTCNGKPVLAYPAVSGSLDRFEYYSARDLDVLIERASWALSTQDKSPVSAKSSSVVAVLGPSGLEMLMTACGLSRLGFVVLILSTRLAPAACLKLIEDTNCSLLCFDHGYKDLAISVQCQRGDKLKTMDFVKREDLRTSHIPSAEWDKISASRRHFSSADRSGIAYIMHSSGSTGMPKPIFTTHQRYLQNARSSFPYTVLMTLPLFHAYGFASFFRAIAGRTLLILLDWSTPLSARRIVDAIEQTKPQMASVVPYTLKLLAESEEAIVTLKSLKLVSFHGSACPDEIGNILVNRGVHLVAHMGSTEAGALATSDRPVGDMSWNYLRFLPSVKPHIWLKPVARQVHELVVLDTLRTKVLSNSDDPPNSLYTKDLFEPHPAIPDAWKYIGRQDDRITLSNGEKVLPLPLEGCIREHPMIKDALIFGIGRAVPGVLIFRADAAADLSNEEYLQDVWPAIAKANERAEGFSQVVPELVVQISVFSAYPQTDKGSIIRPRAYEVFASEIDEAYHKLEATGGRLRLGIAETVEFLSKVCQQHLHIKVATPTTDLYSAGLDSLKAIQLSSIIKHSLDLGRNATQVRPQIIYECSNLDHLAERLYYIRENVTLDEISSSTTASSLVTKYSSFAKHDPVKSFEGVRRHVIVLTGSTGALGCHILSQLIALPTVQSVICLVRATSKKDPRSRVLSALQCRGLQPLQKSLDKIVALQSDLAKDDFGLGLKLLQEIREELSLIIHCAWAVNFNASLDSFERPHITGLKALLDLSMSVHAPQPAKLLFCSSVSVASRIKPPAVVAEDFLEDFSSAQVTGYAQSKFIGEQLVRQANKHGARAIVLRIGQIIGDLESGQWNDTEAIPLIIRSALSLHSLPMLHEKCSWIPVDVLARALIEIADATSPDRQQQLSQFASRPVYNLVNRISFDWTEDLLPALSDAGLKFNHVSPSAWFDKLRHDAEESGDASLNPAVKLLDFFELRYGNGKADASYPQITFQTTEAYRQSLALQKLPDIIQAGYIARFLEYWLRDWKTDTR